MRPSRFGLLGPLMAFGLLAAIPSIVSPQWGWIVSFVVIVAGAVLLGSRLTQRFEAPIGQLAEVVETPPGGSTEDLARAVAGELRAATARLEHAATDSARREAALAHTSDAVVLLDPDGRVEYANPVARAMLQDRVLDVTRRLSPPELQKLVLQATETGVGIASDVTLWVPSARHVRARAVPLGDGATILLLSDLTETHRIDKVRRDFVANVSHELKTPVAGIRALSEVAATALMEGDAETARRFIERLEAESRRLSDLVSDLLDLSRVEAAGQLQLAPVELDALLSEAVATARTVADVKGIKFEVTPSRGVVMGDASQLGMAVKNLVENAVRYSEGGTVRVSSESRDTWTVVTVSDEGIGIPAEEVPRIFERFYRVDKARSRATGGTGLGLAIVRHVAENHGGRIEVKSELGAGSEFTLRLPQSTPAAGNGSNGSRA